ncbi:MAG: hypothetical protein FJZ92_09420 [Chloroflexi bacterium]|nr:hypothetical protein [Chloroflexota bacterium]
MARPSPLCFPGSGAREQRAPGELGMSASGLEEASAHALASEIGWPTDVSRMGARDDPPPHNEPLGPTRARGGPAGLIVRHGFIAHVWGDPGRVDMTFSATKSYLSVLAGVAWDRGMWWLNTALWISAYDHARFGLCMPRGGEWAERRRRGRAAASRR